MKSSRERAEEKRNEKLQKIDEQVASGKLVIRKMTEEELAKNPPRTDAPPRRPRRY